MAVCCFCNLGVVNMNHHSLTVINVDAFHFCPKSKHTQKLLGGWFGSGWGLVSHRNEQQRPWKLAAAELSRPFSVNVGLDSQSFQSNDTSDLGWIGPVPGDIAEVEAYCRIFRAAEHLHVTLMDTLCNPETGECMVSYDSSSEVLEDKIVSVLGCMISLLNKGRQEVLSGRSSIMTSFRVSETMEDKLSPLAVFRSEIKRCCESLHVALVNYLTFDDDRSCDIWRKLQRLKNLCYDLGFPRQDDSPGHMLLANWTPVYFSSSREERLSTGSEMAFWKGGQVTEEGLNWLIQKGFKTIVDLRAENVKDDFYQAAINGAIERGVVQLVKFPVDIGTAPSMEQVEKFAALVSDSSRRPIYLHSREGIRRTSAMISRWRQYMARCEVQISGKPRGSSGTLMQVTNGYVSKIEDEGKLVEENDELLKKSSRKINTPNGVLHEQTSLFTDKHNQNGNGASNGSIPGQAAHVSEVDSISSKINYIFSLDVNPLKSQLPPCNVLSRKEMSSFFKGREISPRSYLNSWRRPQIHPAFSREPYFREGEKNKNNDMGSISVQVEVDKPNGPYYSKNLSYSPQRTSHGNGAIEGDSSGFAVGANLDKFSKGDNSSSKKNEGLTDNEVLGSDLFNKTNEIDISETFSQGQMNEGSPSVALEDNGIELVEENMCASATGVVRIQSRKKAEMFVVRTDGFSCTREKVTESSLAFTHPSTQQQMLLWKSIPKTVLLLKKLGQELMEEAKEVALFLHHQEKMNVLVEPDVHDIFARIPGFGFVHTFYSQDTTNLHEKVDFVACLGGDGVILHASNLFRGPVPPVVSFNLGSLGFLTSHSFGDYKLDLGQIIHGNNTREGVYITLRMRLHCEIFRNGKAVPGKVFDVLNEVVVDRGSNPYLSKIECYEHDRLITKVQGDGVIVATPTGSTAYSSSAGGSMVHPNVPCMLFTPICPHSLSFRPVILPDSARLELKIPSDTRSNAWVSFDGKRRQQLSRGDSVRISMSQHPLPTVNKLDQTGDWFHSLIRCLSWNERLEQKALTSQ